MPSAAGAASTAPSGATPRSASTTPWLSIHDQRLAGNARRLARQFAEALLIDLALQLDDPVDEGLGTGRAARHEHVDRDNLVDALDQRVVVEHAADRGASTHRQHVFRLR